MKIFKTILVAFLLNITCYSFGGDTLFTHPIYPPITFEKGEFVFYKYTAKYVPTSLLHAFRILATNDSSVLEKFKAKSEDSVIESGLFYTGARLRKDFCFEGFSKFTSYFHSLGIYYPESMNTFILLSFHQYLNEKEINWRKNKELSLRTLEDQNKSWKKKKRKLFKGEKVKIKESRGKRKTSSGKNVDNLFLQQF